MPKYFKKLVLYFTINCLFLFISLALYKSEAQLIYLIPTILIYLGYILFLNEKNVVTNQIILAILYNIIYMSLWKVKSFQIPMEIQYILDVISIILVLKIFYKFNKYKKCTKDYVVILSLVFIILSGIFYIINNNVSFINYIMSLRMYFRFLPSYIIIANYKNIYNKNDLNILCILNILFIFIQYFFAGSFGRDDIDGIFGISNVQALLLFLVIIYSIALTSYIYKKINLITFIIISAILFIISGIGEIKMFFIAAPVVTIITVIVNLKKALRFIKLSMPIIVMIIFGYHILSIVSPNFKNFFDYGQIEENIYNYTMESNDDRFYLGRFENIVYTNNNILVYDADKIVGLNVGYAMPNQHWYLETHNNNPSRNIISLYDTPLYEIMGVWSGYQFSSMNIIYLETGLIGIIIFYLVIIIQFRRSYKILKKSNRFEDKCLGIVGISFFAIWTPLMFYYPYLIDISAMLILMIIMGLTTNKYNNIKYLDKQAN